MPLQADATSRRKHANSITTAGDIASRLGGSDALGHRIEGELDLVIVVNNAGVVLDAPLSDTEEADFENVIGANVRGVFLVCREAARRMDAGGHIVNLSSNAVRHPREGQAVYAASKAAIEPMTKVLAKELGERGITVNAVAPGATETDMMPEEAREVAPQMTALGRLGQPEDIAGAVALLCSDDASWITGQVVGVDGGLMS